MCSSNGVSVVIVTFNAEKYILSCLKSVIGSRNIHIKEVIVVDNASQDSTIKVIQKAFGKDERIKIIQLHKNMGFPYACNMGVLHAESEYVVLMNPDVVVDPLCFTNLLAVMPRDKQVAVVQPKILHPGGYINGVGGLMDILGHGFHIGKFKKDHRQYNKSRNILYASFACALVRRDVYLRLGGMDSRFFLYNEDLDFCWRCWLAGYRVVYVPNAVAYHIGQHATRRVPYHAIYFGRRNRLFTIFTNYSLPLGIISSAILLFLYIAAIPYLCIKGDLMEARINLFIIESSMRHLKYLSSKKKFISSIRRVNDIDLLKKKLITFKLIGIRLFIEEFYKRLLYIS